MSKKLPNNPFREGSASHKVYDALAKTEKPLTMADVSRRAKIPFEKTQTLVRAYMNPYHNAPLRRAGITIINGEHGFSLTRCQREPNAKRERSAPKSKKTAKEKKSAVPKKAKTIGAKPKKPKAAKPSPKPDAAPEPIRSAEQIAPSSDTAAQ